ncbi:aminoglycoside phosphotransferase family protein [Leptospira sp. 96542]|nr:aminoglycoside phosphotransferase family protein [Leptospira sp. 96542]
MSEKSSKSKNVLEKPIAIGRSAEIYQWPNDKILKLFHNGYLESEIDLELANTKEVNRLSATEVNCYEKIKIGDRVGLVFDNIQGFSLTKLPDKNPVTFFSIGKILATLHADLHRKKTTNLKDIKTLILGLLKSEPLSFLSESEKKKLEVIIQKLPDGNSILHMDFHPENVIITNGKKIIIDWMTALKGPAEADVAFTVLLFKDAELWPGTPKLKLLFYEFVRKFILKGYLKHYKNLTGISDEQIVRWRLPTLIFRLGLWNIDGEREKLKSSILSELNLWK